MYSANFILLHHWSLTTSKCTLYQFCTVFFTILLKHTMNIFIVCFSKIVKKRYKTDRECIYWWSGSSVLHLLLHVNEECVSMQCVNAYRNDFLAKITLFMQKKPLKYLIISTQYLRVKPLSLNFNMIKKIEIF